MDTSERAAASAPVAGNDSRALSAFMVQHVTRVLEMVDFDLRKAALVLDLDMSELIANIAHWDARPIVISNSTHELERGAAASKCSFGKRTYVGLSPLEERCVDL